MLLTVILIIISITSPLTLTVEVDKRVRCLCQMLSGFNNLAYQN